jgi:hypothetical protein
MKIIYMDTTLKCLSRIGVNIESILNIGELKTTSEGQQYLVIKGNKPIRNDYTKP